MIWVALVVLDWMTPHTAAVCYLVSFACLCVFNIAKEIAK